MHMLQDRGSDTKERQSSRQGTGMRLASPFLCATTQF